MEQYSIGVILDIYNERTHFNIEIMFDSIENIG